MVDYIENRIKSLQWQLKQHKKQSREKTESIKAELKEFKTKVEIYKAKTV